MRKQKTGKNLNSFIATHNRAYGISMVPKREKPDNEGGLFVGKEITVKIVTTGSKGDGIAKYEGHTVIIPETKIKDKVKIIVTNIVKGTIFGKVKSKNEQG